MSKKDSDNVCFWLPNQTAGKMDVLTPHKMIVVFLIQEYLRLKKTVADGVTREQPHQIEVTAGDRKRFCLLLLKLIQYPDLPYKDLYGLLLSPVYGVHPVHLEEFKKLMKLLKTVGIDGMFDLYHEIDKLIVDNTASFQIGIVGLYLRKVFVTMDRMSFHEMKDLYLATVAYYDKGMHAIRLDPCPDASYDCESLKQTQNQYTPIEPSDHGQLSAKWSVKQSELFIAQQSALLKENEAKALPSKELQKRLNEIIRDRPHCSQAYFLTYMNHMRVREFFGSVDALHRVFDRNPSAGAPPSASTVTAEGKEYQYPSLNLAILHAEFGHTMLARTCLRECIMLAQENGDTICLQLAHAWLSHLEGNTMPLPDKNTRESLFHATALRILSYLRQGSFTGESPSKLFGLLMINDLLNSQRSMMDLVAAGIAERTALWTVYGKHEQASLCAQLLLNVDLKSLGKTYNGNGICQVLCSLVVRLAHLGEFGHALVVLEHTKQRLRRYPQPREVNVANHYCNALRAIYRGRWEEAKAESMYLHSYDSTLGKLLLAYIALAKQDFITAEHTLARLTNEELEPLTRIRAMILSANVYLHYGDMNAINELKNALLYAQKYHLQYEEALVNMHIAYVLLVHLDAPKQAFLSLKDGLETILANGPIYDRARALFLFARILVEMEQHSPVGKRLQQLGTLLPTFEEAIEMFEKLECYKAKDVYVYLATAYNELGSYEDRNRYSYRYRLLEEQYPTERQYLNVFL
ncbi:anaphase-promoting complex subunit 5 [Anopheles maculipalpis]|uniref:anaphase-promoting complex subunit 5 n=1 Tax=Anopheles maculipalpis TaxID=1496333 RepID=UPI002158E50F|nr:anaphase-promoting complex subunit 5 [Anopheles maculipalpis]